MQFKDRIKNLRREAKLTQVCFAEMIGKTEGAIRAWETGKAKPDVDTLIMLATYFNCTTDYLLGLSDYKHIDENDNLIALTNALNGSNGLNERLNKVIHILENLSFKVSIK